MGQLTDMRQSPSTLQAVTFDPLKKFSNPDPFFKFETYVKMKKIWPPMALKEQSVKIINSRFPSYYIVNTPH